MTLHIASRYIRSNIHVIAMHIVEVKERRPRPHVERRPHSIMRSPDKYRQTCSEHPYNGSVTCEREMDWRPNRHTLQNLRIEHQWLCDGGANLGAGLGLVVGSQCSSAPRAADRPYSAGISRAGMPTTVRPGSSMLRVTTAPAPMRVWARWLGLAE